MDFLIFKRNVSEHKPNDMQFGRNDACPFCNYQETYNIIKTCDEIVWTKNKYPVLQDAFATLIIESPNHDETMATYSKEYNRKLLRFGIECFHEMKNSGEYKSVVFYKNHGPISGGSLSHAHMQIVGLRNADAYEEVSIENMTGKTVAESENVRVTLSDKPLVGMVETNVWMKLSAFDNEKAFASYSDSVQAVVQHHLATVAEKSFNLFFYEFDGWLITKLVPRFPTAPYFIGYRLAQVMDAETLKVMSTELKAKLDSVW
jgi:ATP adenylyltransferase/5',5'''-P-1,P-4-tetraphosphate phosphorylase II